MTDRKHDNPDLSPAAPRRELLLFGSLLKEYRKKAGLSQRDLAEALDVTRNTVANWESDKSKPEHDLIPPLCALLELPLHQLYRVRSGIGLDPLEERVIQNIRLLDQTGRRIADRIVGAMAEEALLARDRSLKDSFGLFLVRPGSAAAGTGSYVPEDAPSYCFLRKNHINEKADGIVRVTGRSMEPVYQEGDYIYYQSASAASPGEDVIVDTDDGAVIKRLGPDLGLYSVNPAFPYPLKNEDNTLVIRGRVLGTVHSSDEPAKEDLSALEELFAEEIRSFQAKYPDRF